MCIYMYVCNVYFYFVSPLVCYIFGFSQVTVRVHPPPGGGFVQQVYEHIERVRQHYDDYYAEHGPDAGPAPPPPPPPRVQRPRLEIVGAPEGLQQVYGRVMEALRDIILNPADNEHDDSDSTSSTDEAT